MIAYVCDAVAFLHYLIDQLPPDANEAFERAEEGAASLYLPTIAAAELYYLFERKGWKKYWPRLMVEMRRHAGFNYHPFNEQVLDLFGKTRAREIHDRIIISTAKLVKAEALITKDKELKELHEVRTLW